MRNLCLIMAGMILLNGSSVGARPRAAHSFSFDVEGGRSTIYRDISKDLVLRVVEEGAGWNVEVTRKPAGRESSWNLLFHSLRWHGPHPSDVYAWHITGRYFPNERTLDVRGYPYEVRIALVDPVVEGDGSQARFKSGRIKISWRRKL